MKILEEFANSEENTYTVILPKHEVLFLRILFHL